MLYVILYWMCILNFFSIHLNVITLCYNFCIILFSVPNYLYVSHVRLCAFVTKHYVTL